MYEWLTSVICFPPTDPTPTLTSLTQLLDGVAAEVRNYLDIPSFVYADLKRQHSDPALFEKSLCEWYLSNHPAPSWRHVAEALYRGREHDVLEVVRNQVQYLKGGSVLFSGGYCWGIIPASFLSLECLDIVLKAFLRLPCMHNI